MIVVSGEIPTQSSRASTFPAWQSCVYDGVVEHVLPARVGAIRVLTTSGDGPRLALPERESVINQVIEPVFGVRVWAKPESLRIAYRRVVMPHDVVVDDVWRRRGRRLVGPCIMVALKDVDVSV